MDDIEWRSLIGERIVDIIAEGREELERRRNEASACLELAFGPRDEQHQPPRRGRPPKNAFPEAARGALDAEGVQ
jgi:hypothetical protein